MTARRLGLAVLSATMVGSGAYVFVYLYRWEWNRALVSGVIFLAAELALIGGLLADRIRAVDRRLDAAATSRGSARLRTADSVRGRLHETRPAARSTFAWLGPPDRAHVFVPVLLGAGVLLSAVAWVVERIARVTIRPVAEHGLARRLGSLALPPHGFLDDGDGDPLALLRGPVGEVRR